MGYLFYPHVQVGYGHPAKSAVKTNIEKADSSVIAIFRELQVAWRRQAALQITLDKMPVSHEERRCWQRLIRYLAKLPHTAMGRAARKGTGIRSSHDHRQHNRKNRS